MHVNVTFRAEKELIEQARRRAKGKNTTLNAEFRHWLEQYIKAPQTSADLDELMDHLDYARTGKTFTRDQHNER